MLSRRRFSILLSGCLSCLAAVFSSSTHGNTRSLLQARLLELQKNISGRLISREQADYESVRRNMSWQFRKTSRRPQIMVQASSNRDVSKAVQFAKNNKLQIAVRSGGHSWVHSSIREEGMLLDLGNFKDLEIDENGLSARAGPALTARELASALGKVGLGFPVAHCSTVALGGYLLGGGQAWNWGSWGGAACNSITALDVINAEGELIHVDENNHPELLWAARGAGPGFPAIVTQYHLRLYPLPGAIRMNTYIWPLADTLAVSKWLGSVSGQLSDKVEVLMFLSSLPEAIDGVSRVVIISAVAFADTDEEASTLLSPLTKAKHLSTPLVVEESSPMTFDSLLNLVDRSFFPCRAAADTFWFDQSMETVMEKFIEHFAAAPSPYSNVLCEIRPKLGTLADAAYSMRRATYLSPYAFWLDEKDDEINLQWMKKTQQILAPLSVGHFISEADLEADPERARRSFSRQSWDRLQEVRHKYDPGGLFHTFLGH